MLLDFVSMYSSLFPGLAPLLQQSLLLTPGLLLPGYPACCVPTPTRPQPVLLWLPAGMQKPSWPEPEAGSPEDGHVACSQHPQASSWQGICTGGGGWGNGVEVVPRHPAAPAGGGLLAHSLESVRVVGAS